VFSYPLMVSLAPTPQTPLGPFRFTVTGPPGHYTILTSTNLTTWSELGPSHIPLGEIIITDTTSQFSPRKFYRAQQQIAPTNVVVTAADPFPIGR
jgi:hypothetical protein